MSSSLVLQRFAWRGVASGKGFLLSSYGTAAEAAEHAAALDTKEGRALQLFDAPVDIFFDIQ